MSTVQVLLSSAGALNKCLVLLLQSHSVSCYRHSRGNENDRGNVKIQHVIGLSHFCKAGAEGHRKFRDARIGRDYDARPLWLTMFSRRKPTFGFQPVTSLRSPLMQENVHVPVIFF